MGILNVRRAKHSWFIRTYDYIEQVVNEWCQRPVLLEADDGDK